MYKHLLIAVDGSDESAKAMAQGFALAKALTAKATVVTATEPWTEAAYATLPTPSMISAYEKSTAGNAASILNNAKQNAEGVGVHCEVHHARDQHAPDAIIKLAKEKKCERYGIEWTRQPRSDPPWQHFLKVLTFSQVLVLVCH